MSSSTMPRIDYGFWPERYPFGRRKTIEIARVQLYGTVHGDDAWVCAKRDGRWIHYMVFADNGYDYVVRPKRTRRPLTLRRLIQLIDTAVPEGEEDNPWPGLAAGTRDYNYEHSDDPPEDYINFYSVSSTIYLQLHDHYEQEKRTWCEEMQRRLVAENNGDEWISSKTNVEAQHPKKGARRGTSTRRKKTPYVGYISISGGVFLDLPPAFDTAWVLEDKTNLMGAGIGSKSIWVPTSLTPVDKTTTGTLYFQNGNGVCFEDADISAAYLPVKLLEPDIEGRFRPP